MRFWKLFFYSVLEIVFAVPQARFFYFSGISEFELVGSNLFIFYAVGENLFTYRIKKKLQYTR